VKNYAEPALMPVESVQMNAEVWAVQRLKQRSNVPMPAVHVRKNAKSTITKRAKNAQKNAENVKQNVERLRLKFLNLTGYWWILSW
jgi:hypothetical protein